MDRSKKPKKIVVAVVFILVAVGLAVAGVFISRGNQTSDTNGQTTAAPIPQVAIAPSGIDYPTGWTEAEEIAVSEKESGVTSVATKEEPEARVIIREVEGDRAPNFDISKLPEEIESALNAEVEGFTLVEKRTLKIGGNDAVKIAYTQLNSEDQQIYKFSMFIIPAAQKTYYITYSTPDDIASLSDDITKINQSLAEAIKLAL